MSLLVGMCINLSIWLKIIRAKSVWTEIQKWKKIKSKSDRYACHRRSSFSWPFAWRSGRCPRQVGRETQRCNAWWYIAVAWPSSPSSMLTEAPRRYSRSYGAEGCGAGSSSAPSAAKCDAWDDGSRTHRYSEVRFNSTSRHAWRP